MNTEYHCPYAGCHLKCVSKKSHRAKYGLIKQREQGVVEKKVEVRQIPVPTPSPTSSVCEQSLCEPSICEQEFCLFVNVPPPTPSPTSSYLFMPFRRRQIIY